MGDGLSVVTYWSGREAATTQGLNRKPLSGGRVPIIFNPILDKIPNQ